MKNLISSFIVLVFSMMLFSCKKNYDGDTSFENIKYSTNKKAYPVTKMDSAQAISSITRQKLQEFYDLSTLYASGNRDTEIDSVIFVQMKNYLLTPDSITIKPIVKELDSLKARYAKLGNVSTSKIISEKDTLDFATFHVEFYNAQRKSIGNFTKYAQFMLKKSPVKFKKEFKFYFVKFPDELPKDSTSVGVTR